MKILIAYTNQATYLLALISGNNIIVASNVTFIQTCTSLKFRIIRSVIHGDIMLS